MKGRDTNAQLTLKRVIVVVTGSALLCAWLWHVGSTGVFAITSGALAGFALGGTGEALARRKVRGLCFSRWTIHGAAYGVILGMVGQVLWPGFGHSLGLLIVFGAVLGWVAVSAWVIGGDLPQR
jgi:Na+/proline symporter